MQKLNLNALVVEQSRTQDVGAFVVTRDTQCQAAPATDSPGPRS